MKLFLREKQGQNVRKQSRRFSLIFCLFYTASPDSLEYGYLKPFKYLGISLQEVSESNSPIYVALAPSVGSVIFTRAVNRQGMSSFTILWGKKSLALLLVDQMQRDKGHASPTVLPATHPKPLAFSE